MDVSKTPEKSITVFKKVSNIVSTVAVVISVLLAVLLGGVRLIGFTPFAILSPSMAPTYNTGDLVYVKKTAPEDVKVGDVMTFVIADNKTATHRVIEVDTAARQFRTQGDANVTPDLAPVAYENVVGTVSFGIPKLGYVANFLTTAKGKWTAVIVLCALMLLCLIPDLLRRETKPAPEPEPEPEGEESAPDEGTLQK